MAEKRVPVRKPAAAERRPAAAPRGPAVAAIARPIPVARSLQQRLGNRGTQALAAQLAARSSAPGIASARSAGTGQLILSQPGDAHEREADRMADAVMRMPDRTSRFPGPAIGGAGKLQRAESSAEAAQVSPAVAASIQSMQGGGSPLPPATRAFFEPRFGTDFGHVRVHTGSRAAEASRAISAKAFTVGADIVFAGGEFAPQSRKGQQLLAHELTHVVQQDGGRLRRTTIWLQAEKTADSPGSAEGIIDRHTTLNFLDEEGLGVDLAGRLPAAVALVNAVLDHLSDSDRDDVAYEIVGALPKLADQNEALRIRFVREMVYGVVTGGEEAAIAQIWLSFGPALPQVAEKEEHRALWKKSLWESDELGKYTKPVTDAFGGDVVGVAKAYLAENQQTLAAEALRYGIDLEGRKTVAPSHPDYLKSVRAMAPGVLKLTQDLDELKELSVGYVVGERSTIEPNQLIPSKFDPAKKPARPPKGVEQPPWPSWDQVNTQYNRISAVISAFANLYPTVYLLIQQGKLKALDQATDASQAQQVISETLHKTEEKIHEANQKIASEKITWYDLTLIQNQLLEGDVKTGYAQRYPWDRRFYQDIARDNLKGHEARQFWIDLGLSLVAAAALIAAPFTGGASAAFLVGFGIGIGAAQAGISWDKYLKTATLGDANVKEELSLVAKGEVSAKLIEAIVQTAAVFLDVYGARAARTGAAATRGAIEAAEKGLKEQLAEEARKRALGAAAKEAGMTAGGAGLAIGLHELAEDEPVPDMQATAAEWVLDLGAGQPEPAPSSISRSVVFRAPGPPGTPAASALKEPILLTGGEFEMTVEKALLQGKIGDIPQMSFVIPGQYTGSGWGIDRIGIAFDEATGRVRVFHLEMKFVSPGSPHVPELGKTASGTQTGRAWTENAVDGFLTNTNPTARAAQKRLRAALGKMYPSEAIDNAFMRTFLHGKLTKAPVRIIVPHWADFSVLYKQVAALVRSGRKIKITKVLK